MINILYDDIRHFPDNLLLLTISIAITEGGPYYLYIKSLCGIHCNNFNRNLKYKIYKIHDLILHEIHHVQD